MENKLLWNIVWGIWCCLKAIFRNFIHSFIHSFTFFSFLPPLFPRFLLTHTSNMLSFFSVPGKIGGIFRANYMGAFHLIYMSHISSGEAKVAKEEWRSAGAFLSPQPIHPRAHGSYTSNRAESWFRITSSLSLISFIMSWKDKTDPNSARWLGNTWNPSNTYTHTPTHTHSRIVMH